MRRRFGFFLILAAVVAAGVTLTGFFLDESVLTWPPATDLAFAVAPGCVLITAMVTLVMVFRRPPERRRPVVVTAVLLILAFGFLPQATDAGVRYLEIRTREAERQAIEASYQAGRAEIRAAIAAGTPLSPDAARDFVDFVAASDQSWRGFADNSAEATGLLHEALTAGVLDPNIEVLPPLPEEGESEAEAPAPTPLFVHFHRDYIAPDAPRFVNPLHWQILELLVAGGADLELTAATPVAADLAKTPVPDGERNLRLE